MDVTASSEIYQFRVVLRDTSPHVWRRIWVRRSIALGEFHHTLQVAYGWCGSRPYRFLIRGEAHRIDSAGDPGAVDQLRLADFHFLPKERFLYEYDVDSNGGPRWRHQIRFERALPSEPQRLYPVCIGGVGVAPPEDCGGPKGLAEFCTLFTPRYILHRLAAILDAGLTAKGIEELQHLRPWITLNECDRCTVNRKLKLELASPGQGRTKCMKTEIHITIKSDDGQVQEQEPIACLQRGTLTPEELGMNLSEAKELMHSVQETMVRCQTAEFVKQQSVCPHCGKKRSLKGNHEIVYRTLFGSAV